MSDIRVIARGQFPENLCRTMLQTACIVLHKFSGKCPLAITRISLIRGGLDVTIESALKNRIAFQPQMLSSLKIEDPLMPQQGKVG